MHYKGVEYTVQQRSDGAWQWVFRTPHGPDKGGVTRGTRRWAETVARRGIDIWWLMNPDVSGVQRAAE